MVLFDRKLFSEYVSDLRGGWNIAGLDGSIRDFVSYKVTVNLHMFHLFMVSGNDCYRQGILIVTMQ